MEIIGLVWFVILWISFSPRDRKLKEKPELYTKKDLYSVTETYVIKHEKDSN